MHLRKQIGFAVLCVMGVLSLASCTTSIQIKVLEPAKIGRAAVTKQIAVSPFKGDSVGLSAKIETVLSKQVVEGESFFTTVSRNEVDRLIKEQNLQYSGVLNEDRLVEAGQLLGVQAFVSGEVSAASGQDETFYEERFRCLDKKCQQLQTYQVRCTRRNITLAATVKMTDVARGDIIVAENFSKHSRSNSCVDQAQRLPAVSAGLDSLANRVARQFVAMLTPQYRTMEVELLEDARDYSASQEKTLEVALEFIEAGRYDKADALLTRLLSSTQERSYVAAYNLGVVKEAQGDYARAKRLYQLADELQTKPVEAINKAVIRIDQVIRKYEQARSQLEQ